MAIFDFGKKQIRPLAPRGSSLPEYPVTASKDVSVLHKVDELKRHQSGTCHVWQWHNPDTAPRIKVIAADTAYWAKMIDGTYDPDLELPYYSQIGFSQIQVACTLAYRSTYSAYLLACAASATLVTAVATVSSAYQEISNCAPCASSIMWRAQQPSWVESTFSAIWTPELPATRRIAIKIAAAWVSTLGVVEDPLNAVNVEHDVRVVRVLARDVWED